MSAIDYLILTPDAKRIASQTRRRRAGVARYGEAATSCTRSATSVTSSRIALSQHLTTRQPSRLSSVRLRRSRALLAAIFAVQ
jgi:hypothetical protein